ncbi:MAG: hypothetical protein METHP_01726 [Methanoregula sp. SKADARSKE-2]|nr:MAG: hypothetical protein METHP_01726 [Methanoregula sp. SKADARSKE-2]
MLRNGYMCKINSGYHTLRLDWKSAFRRALPGFVTGNAMLNRGLPRKQEKTSIGGEPSSPFPLVARAQRSHRQPGRSPAG